MKNNKYLFTVRLIGYGKNPDDAWRDAVEATNLDDDITPDKDDYEIIEGDDD